jgi:hypothetical protein
MKLPILLLLGLATTAMGADASWQWRKTTHSLALEDGGRVVWQFNHDPADGKPYFHPLSLADGTVVTAFRPTDHPWHRALWWSWKTVNGLNFWEEDKTNHQSEGVTELRRVTVKTNADFSASFELTLGYHPRGGADLLREKRSLRVSRPDANGSFYIDWDSEFTAGDREVKLDRTPPRNWSGGYAGLSLRMAAACKGWTFLSSEGLRGATNNYGKTARWMDFSQGKGIAIFDNPLNPRHPTAWYPNNTMPWVTPAFLFHEPYTLPAGGDLRFRYRVLLHSRELSPEAIETLWKDYTTRKEN